MFEVSTVEKFMRIALAEAEAAAKEGNVPVGAVIVDDDGNIISHAHNTRESLGHIHGHAEINAINEASLKPGKEYSLIVTLEPCPMCTGAIIDSHIKTIYYGAPNKTNGAMGTVCNLISNKRIDVFGGFLSNDCSKMLSTFFKTL